MINSLTPIIAKHLPPSASDLRLLDVNGDAGAGLLALRADLAIDAVSGQVDQWQIAASSADAIVACNYILNDAFLAAALSALRPGGRLIIANSQGKVTKELGQRLEAAGYVRILIEPLPESGVLLRGERIHTTDDTLDRIQQTAGRDSDQLTLENFKGRYVYLLIQQTPNKPAWRLEPDEVIRWHAVGLTVNGKTSLLGFSSLPKAVSLMQPAVLVGKIKDVNKVGKFNKSIPWILPLMLNPTLEDLQQGYVVLVEVDPTLAEAPDE